MSEVEVTPDERLEDALKSIGEAVESLGVEAYVALDEAYEYQPEGVTTAEDIVSDWTSWLESLLFEEEGRTLDGADPLGRLAWLIKSLRQKLEDLGPTHVE